MFPTEEEAVEKTANKISEIGFEFDLEYMEDDIDDSFVSDDETVRDWLENHGAELNESNMLIMEWNDIEQNVQDLHRLALQHARLVGFRPRLPWRGGTPNVGAPNAL